MKINEKIKELRLAAGLSQGELARFIYNSNNDGLEFTPQAISLYEQGKRKISFEVLETICSAVGYKIKIEPVTNSNRLDNTKLVKKKSKEEVLSLNFKERVEYLLKNETDEFISRFLDIQFNLLEKLPASIIKECLEEKLDGISNAELSLYLEGNQSYYSIGLAHFISRINHYLDVNKKIPSEVKESIYYIYVSFEFNHSGELDYDGYYYITEAELFDINKLPLNISSKDICVREDEDGEMLPLDDSIDTDVAREIEERNRLSENGKYLIQLKY